MNKTFKISFSLKNTYRVNGILFSLKQIPLLNRLFPAKLYQTRGLKIFANVLAILWEMIHTFINKLLYLVIMVSIPGRLYQTLPENEVFFHIFLFLSLIGSFMNTHLFHLTKNKYYAIALMRMDARECTLIDYFYALLKVIVGFMPFTILFGTANKLPLWFCIVLPFCIVGMKLFIVALRLWDYEKRGFGYNDNKLSKYTWGCICLLLCLGYGLPALGFTMPTLAAMIFYLLCIPLGMIGLLKVLNFQDYRAVNQELLPSLNQQMDVSVTTRMIKEANEKRISADISIISHRKGFYYLNELFIKRHRKILWDFTKKVSYACTFLIAAALLVIYLLPQHKPIINKTVTAWLPNFVFVMYTLNRGTNFTQALFMNCDHSLLHYSFYKQPKFILKLFQIRLFEIMKVNAVPALIIGVGLALILFASGGTENPLDYAVLLVSILCMSLFFSIHYLTIYYLMQPYNTETKMKSGMYMIVLTATYFLCFFIMKLQVPILLFGIMTIVFCMLYSIIASILVYCFAPKTFRIRT